MPPQLACGWEAAIPRRGLTRAYDTENAKKGRNKDGTNNKTNERETLRR